MDNYRYILYKLSGLRIVGKCVIFGPLTIRPIGKANNIQIGNGTFINTDVRFGCPYDIIKIGNNCEIAPRVCFETISHGTYYDPINGRGEYSKPIVVEDEVWIGCGAIILQGVTIGKGAVIAAGAVVTKDVPSKRVYGGIPAQALTSRKVVPIFSTNPLQE